jgi:hypothetical protein
MVSPEIWSDPMIEDHLIDQTQDDPATSEPDDELWDSGEVCAYFGGGSTKPISIATLYRGIGKVYPPPINVSQNVVRWVPRECRAARQRMIEERGKPKKLQGAARRGRKRSANAAKAKTATEAETT